MQTEQPAGRVVGEAIVALMATGAVLYFCFTPPGRRVLGRLEAWLDASERETVRLLESAGRLAELAGTVSAALGGPDRPGRRIVDVAEFPAPVRRAGR